MRIDHLVYGVPDLEQGVDDLFRLLGVRATTAGRHPGRGTWNAVLDLGEMAYLEIIAPDPSQPDSEVARRSFGVHTGMTPQMVGWSWQCEDIDERASASRLAGYDPGEVVPKSRETPDGKTVSWRMTNRPVTPDNFVTPFLIEWTGETHPSEAAPTGVLLAGVSMEHPSPVHVLGQLQAIGADVDVALGPRPRLLARLSTVHGVIELE